MSGRWEPISELDLLAYADGFLDDDPCRKAEVEEYLIRNPADADRVRAYREQNDWIRRAYGPLIDRPVPERLMAVLDEHRRPWKWRATRVVAAAAVVVVAVTAGWAAGRFGGPPGWTPEAFVEEAAVAAGEPVAEGGVVQANARAPAGPLETRIPDLSAHGLSFVRKEWIDVEGQRALRVAYEAPSGEQVFLVLGERWARQPSRLEVAESGDRTIAYWVDGPFVYGLVGALGKPETAALAQSIRKEAAEPRHMADNVNVHAPGGRVEESGVLSDDLMIRTGPAPAVEGSAAPAGATIN